VTAEAATTAAAEAGITSAQPLDSDAGRFHREAARARAGELFTEHATLIQRICSRLLRDDFEAEDAAQQTFLSAYKAMLTGAEPRDGEAWLATIACSAAARGGAGRFPCSSTTSTTAGRTCTTSPSTASTRPGSGGRSAACRRSSATR
jgi:hypothetical protein